jgi:hypothetical protein
MYLPTTNTLAWATNSTERLRLDASGNLGLGTTPSAWLIYKAFDIGPYSSLSAAGSEVEVNSNAAYLAGTGWTYKQTAFASQYRQTIGQHRWYTAASGTAGTAISFTQAMTLDVSGNLGIGTTSPASSFEIVRNSSSGGSGLFPNIRLDNQNASGYTGLYFLNSGAQKAGLEVKNDVGALQFFTGATERARIDSSGNLLVGTTSTDPSGASTTGAVLGQSGYVSVCASSNVSGVFGRRTSTGDVVIFRYNTTQVGTINTNGTGTTYNSASDQRLKENIVDAPGALSSVNAIKVRSFDWKADGSHVDYGYIAQELSEVAPEAVSVPANPEEMMGVDFGKLTPRIIKALQELTARLEALEGAK